MTPAGYRAHLEAAWAEHLAPRAPDAPTVVSLFAGCGGSSLGYSMAGCRELFAVERNPHAAAVLRANFPGVRVWEGDVTALPAEEALDAAGVEPGELDILDGSPPCQGFSFLGKRKAGDERDQLWREHMRLVRAFEPAATVIENVPGMAQGAKRRILAELIAELHDAGYVVSAGILSATWYGVAQDRRRLIIIGIRGDAGEAEGAAPGLPTPTFSRPLAAGEVVDFATEPDDLPEVPQLSERFAQMHPWVPVGGYGSDVNEMFTRGGRKKAKRRDFSNLLKIHPSKPARALPGVLKAQGRGYGSMVHPHRPRAIAISEARLISGFPPGFVLDGSYQEKYERLANCVPPLLMRAVARHVVSVIKSRRPQEVEDASEVA